ncbi:SAM-dependent methyltransferase [Streptomyces sp. NPDC093085]|uniref:SAM-dependent methyltransferase n=1 Tax=Streptomyces sp. NPDC093085 TaxID=3155068 RepID=UPI00341D87E4
MTRLQLPDGVGVTALMAAYARAQELRRDNPLFEDEAAALFMADALGISTRDGESLPRLGPARDDGTSDLWNSLAGSFVARTPFYDTYLTERIAAGCRQVVQLGAGLDGRAFRLPLGPDVAMYEIDTPVVLDFKAGVLARHGVESLVKRVPVGVDLRDDWVGALEAAGFDVGQPTAWMAEGLFMYFTAEEADGLMAAVTAASAPGSTVAGEYLSRRSRLGDVAASDADEQALIELSVAADQGGPGSAPDIWLAGHGWRGAYHQLVDELAAIGRPVPPLWRVDRDDPLRVWLFTGALGADAVGTDALGADVLGVDALGAGGGGDSGTG